MLSLAAGGVFLLTDDELDKAYTCSTSGETGIFENVTYNVGYWNDFNNYSTCIKGEWIPRKQYCNDNNISNCKEIISTTQDVPSGILWCTDKCDEIV